jgi:adenosine deaminase
MKNMAKTLLMSRIFLAGLCSFLFLSFPANSASVSPGTKTLMEKRFADLRKSPPELYAFLLRMPKGGDLHNHLAGAVYAEHLLKDAVQDHLCVTRRTLGFVRGNQLENAGACSADQMPALEVQRNDVATSQLIDSLSMRNFVPGNESAHDHFFAMFGKINAINDSHSADYLTEVIQRAAEQNESYLEMMALIAGPNVMALGAQTEYQSNFDSMRDKLMSAGLPKEVTDLQQYVVELDRNRRQALGCEANPQSPSCQVTVRYILQVLRGNPPQQVFAQLLAGFMLAAQEPLVVSVNMVQPEDGFLSMRDYHLHMQMVDYVKRLYPNVHVTLHAGELASGLVPPEGLRFHVREAIQLGHAERIGHGVDIMYELDSIPTLKQMAKDKVDVEINLTSNDVILGVRGNQHPFPVYRKYGVPVTLSTDDEGVSRTHLTQEYQRAVLDYGLSYADVKEIVRNSLQFSFLPGDSYWQDSRYRRAVAPCEGAVESTACRTFVQQNEKARVQQDLEIRFREFEKMELAH